MKEAQNFVQSYIKRADKILKANLVLQETERKLKEARVNLEKEEREFIQELEDIGLKSLTLTDGYTLSIEEQYHCSLNKNLDDQDNVARWLQQNGGEELVSTVGEIAEQDIGIIKDLGVRVIEHYSMNTPKIKAFVKSGLGITGQTQQFQITELPKGLHFFIQKEIKIE